MKNNIQLTLALLSAMTITGPAFAGSEFKFADITNNTGKQLMINVFTTERQSLVHQRCGKDITCKPQDDISDLRLKMVGNKNFNENIIEIGTEEVPAMFQLHVSAEHTGKGHGSMITNTVKLSKNDKTVAFWQNKVSGEKEVNKKHLYRISLEFNKDSENNIAPVYKIDVAEDHNPSIN